MKRAARWFWVIPCLLLLLLISPAFSLPIELTVYAAIGWILFIKRVFPQITIDWSGVATAAVAVVLLLPGLHWFLRWLSASWSANRSPKNDPATSQNIDEHRVRTWPWRWTIALVCGVVMAFAAGTAMVGFTHQAVWTARSPEPLLGAHTALLARIHARSQLKMLALALHNHNHASGSLPQGATMDRQGRMLHGWQAMLLPFAEESSLFARIDLEQPWTAKANADAFRTIVRAYRIDYPRDASDFTADGFAVTDIAGNVHVLGPARRLRLSDIADGASQTILAGEAINHRKAWGDPTNWRDAAEPFHSSPNSLGGPWAGATQVVMADGSVRVLRDDTDARVLQALATPAAGDEVPEF